jgi:hypothetical protein
MAFIIQAEWTIKKNQKELGICLVTHHGCRNIGVVVDEMFPNTLAKQFGITIWTETTSIRPGASFEVAQGQENEITWKVLQSIHPIVMSCSIHQDEGVAKILHQDTVSESNVHMDDVQEARLSLINNAPSVSLRDCSIIPKSQWKLSIINLFAVEAGLEDVFVVPETTTSQSTMEFFRGPMGLHVGTVSPITRANGWKGRPLMANQASDVIPR